MIMVEGKSTQSQELNLTVIFLKRKFLKLYDLNQQKLKLDGADRH